MVARLKALFTMWQGRDLHGERYALLFLDGFHLRVHLEDACPVHARPELKRDYHRIIYADSGLNARAAYDTFMKKWTTLCPSVARSLEEAGLDLLTFYAFPKATWKSLRTTNALENLNREFRRRTKTQASQAA